MMYGRVYVIRKLMLINSEALVYMRCVFQSSEESAVFHTNKERLILHGSLVVGLNLILYEIFLAGTAVLYLFLGFVYELLYIYPLTVIKQIELERTGLKRGKFPFLGDENSFFRYKLTKYD